MRRKRVTSIGLVFESKLDRVEHSGKCSEDLVLAQPKCKGGFRDCLSRYRDDGVSLSVIYLAWFLVIAALYPFCHWVAAVKARRTDWWLSYL